MHVDPDDGVVRSKFTIYELSIFLPMLESNQNDPSAAPQSKEPRKLQVEMCSLTMDPTAVMRVRRWLLAFAVGVYVFFCSCFWPTKVSPVEFDIDTGPTVDGLYPPLTLHPAEAETLYQLYQFYSNELLTL